MILPLIFLLGLNFFALGQSLQIHTEMDPPEADSGEEVTMEVHVSTEATIWEFETDIYFDSNLYDLENISDVTVDSWLGTPAQLEVDMSVQGDTVHLHVQRVDRSLHSGTGHVLNLDGITLLDDIHTKRPAIYVKVQNQSKVLVCPVPSSGQITIESETVPTSVLLSNGLGQTWTLPASREQNLEGFPEGIYFLQMVFGKTHFENKRIVLKR